MLSPLMWGNTPDATTTQRLMWGWAQELAERYIAPISGRVTVTSPPGGRVTVTSPPGGKITTKP